MIIIIKKTVRPNNDIKFYFEVAKFEKEFSTYFHDKFVISGKFISSTKIISSDKLSMITTSKWISHSSFLEFMNDDICYDSLIPEHIHNTHCNIYTEITAEEIE